MPAAGVMVRVRGSNRLLFMSDLLGSGGVTATTGGTWTNVAGICPFTVDVTATAGTIQLDGHLGRYTASGGLVAPHTATNGFTVGSAVSNTRSALTITAPVVYVKARVTARTGGTLSARLFGEDKS